MIKLNISDVILNASTFASFGWSEILSLIATIIVILLFGIERYLNHKANIEDLDRTWYYKILIDPNLEKINIFFDDVIKHYFDSAEFLFLSSSEPHDEFIKLKAYKIGAFQELKRSFEIDLTTPILKKYKDTGDKLNLILINLEDEYTVTLDNSTNSKDEKDNFKIKCYILKAEWLDALYEPIRKINRRKSFINYIKGIF